MAGPIGTTPEKVSFTANGTQIIALNRTRVKGAMTVILSNTGGTNFSGGTITLSLSLDGATPDPAAATATFTIGTDTAGNLKTWVDKPAAYLHITAASLAGGSGTPTATVWIGAY